MRVRTLGVAMPDDCERAACSRRKEASVPLLEVPEAANGTEASPGMTANLKGLAASSGPTLPALLERRDAA
jgi:hypothetical protein